MMRIDGSLGEGGGQTLRTALSLSAITKTAFTMENIRAKRQNPGLRAQHVACVQAVAKITGAKVQGASVGSTCLSFSPATLEGGAFEFDIGTAGATTLLFQCLVPALLFAGKPSTLTLHGGTDVPFAPPSHFTENTFTKALHRFGAHVSARTVKHGFYPAGGGTLFSKIEPSELSGARFQKRGKLKKLRAVCLSANLPDHVNSREKAWLQKHGVDEVEERAVKSKSPGNVVSIEAEHENAVNGFSALGESGKPAEAVTEEALFEWEKFDKSGAAIDGHLCDQLLIYAALSKGKTVLESSDITGHVRTNATLLARWLDAPIGTDGRTMDIEGKGFSAVERQER